MTKGQKIAVGSATLLPLIYTVVVVSTPLRSVFTTDPTSPDAPDWLLYFTAFHFFMYLYTGFLLTFYLIHLFGNRNIGKERKILWTLLLILGSLLTMPVYWFLHIWRAR